MTPDLQRQVQRLNAAIRKKVSTQAYRGLLAIGIGVLASGQRNAPRDTGNLMGSGFVIGSKRGYGARAVRLPGPSPIGDRESLEVSRAVTQAQTVAASTYRPLVIVGFGASYALFVHEGDPSWNWHDGGPKYLERAVIEWVPKARSVMRKEMSK